MTKKILTDMGQPMPGEECYGTTCWRLPLSVVMRRLRRSLAEAFEEEAEKRKQLDAEEAEFASTTGRACRCQSNLRALTLKCRPSTALFDARSQAIENEMSLCWSGNARASLRTCRRQRRGYRPKSTRSLTKSNGP
jgi:hypothetical protein